MSLLSVGKLYLLRETAVPHGCFTQRVAIGTENLPGKKGIDNSIKSAYTVLIE